ncbi:MAG: 5-(carboxyamino)imidazole ribonucleotide mutase [Myxococcota bacterium]
MAKQASVALVMGSESDLPKLENALAVLKALEIPLEVRVISAHRTPDELREWLDAAVPDGLKVIMAAAGMAAHLAGACAAHTTIPVIGIPVVGGALSGFDALLSTVNMPGGVPVATVGLGSAGAKNAALLAAQILGVADPAIAERVAAMRAADADAVREKDAKVRADHPAQ